MLCTTSRTHKTTRSYNEKTPWRSHEGDLVGAARLTDAHGWVLPHVDGALRLTEHLGVLRRFVVLAECLLLGAHPWQSVV